MNRIARVLVAFTVTLSVAGSAFAGRAFAEPPAGEAPKTSKPAKRTRDDAGSLRGVNEIEDELVIVGKIQKPEVFYVLGRTDFSYRGIKLARSFVDEIRQSVRSNPF